MASVAPPDPTYVPNLPKEVVEDGLLSEVQLESLVYAGQAHGQMLRNGERRGYFIGDGTGVGKGRQIAGIILDNFRQGRTKAVWLTKSAGLIDDARRDAGDLGIDPKEINALNKWKKGGKIDLKSGIIFASYDTLKGGHTDTLGKKDEWWAMVNGGKIDSRVAQLAKWLGKDFDGVIAMDEAHRAGNAIALPGKRGVKKASATGVSAVDLQLVLPKARIVYVSATGATEVENLSYADRLGIWGEGTPFTSKQDFFNKIRAGGISAMEIVARDMKAQGLYGARSISYKGVEFQRLTQNLTDAQRNIYDKIAQSWQIVLENLDETMGESGMNNNGMARGKALGAFFGAQQRFFNQLLTAMELPAVIADMEKELEAGSSLVLQIVNTNEATQNRQIASKMSETAPGEESPLEDLDLSPKDVLLQYLSKSYPTTLYEQVADPNDPNKTIWVEARDSEGNIVQDPKAIAAKERLMDQVALLDIPDNPLEQILNHFGEENIAEITGRTQRIARVKQEDGARSTKIQRRSPANRKVEAKEFQDGKRRILVFSDAGGTGYSFHASNKAKNQQRRIHYLVQAGWRADNALQGFGRTHRTDQASAPFYKLAETNIAGHKRFISTIARRLAQLGALTTGERKSTGQGMFSEADNLESKYAEDAIIRLIHDLHGKKAADYSMEQFAKGLGFTKTMIDRDTGEVQRRNMLVDDRTGALLEDKIPDIPQFLNRVLALPLDEQNLVFKLFMDRFEARIARAMNDGTYDPGTQTYPGKELVKVSDETVFESEGTTAKTRIVEVDDVRPVEFTTFADVRALSTNPVLRYVRNRKSGRVYALKDGGTQTSTATGAVEKMYRRIGSRTYDQVAMSSVNLAPGEQIEQDGKTVTRGQGNYEEITPAQAQIVWEEEIQQAPKTTSERVNFLVGAMLPIWDRLQIGNPKIYRFTTTTGEPLLGVLIPAKDVPGVRTRMGAKNTMTAKDAMKLVLDTAARLTLANGWTIKKALVSAENRVEVTGLNWEQTQMFVKNMGGFMERIQYTPRFFIPNADVMERVIGQSPVVDVNGQRLAPAAAKSAMDEAEDRRTALVIDNMGLAGAIAREYSNIPKQTTADIVSEAKIGLVIAAEKFDPTLGVPFSGYAGRIIRNRLNDAFRASKRSAEMVEDAPLPSGETKTDLLADVIASTANPGDLETVRKVLASIPERPRRALEGFMAGDTWEAIGEREGITHEGARKRALGAMAAMKSALAKLGITSTDHVFPSKEEFSRDRIATIRLKEAESWQSPYIPYEPADFETAPAASKAVAAGLISEAEFAAAEKALWDIVRSPEADTIYDALPESQGGRLISGDIVRLLSSAATGTPENMMRFVESTIKPAGSYSFERLRKELAAPSGREYFGIMAGGYGAGKSTVREALDQDGADLIYDASLRHRAGAERLIDEALANGWKKVRIAYVIRPLEMAAGGALLRAWEDGRWINLFDLLKSHIDAQQTILALHAKYDGDNRVQIRHYLNDGTPENPKKIAIVPTEEVARGGRLSYAYLSDKDVEALANRVEAEFQNSAATDFEKQIVRLAGRGTGSPVSGGNREGTQSPDSGPETAPVGAKRAPELRSTASPRAAAEIHRIEEEGRRARQYREDHKKAAVENNGIGAQEFWKTNLSGRLDKLEFYAPGAKAAILDDRRQEALVAATINAMLDTMRKDIQSAFGYPKFWQHNRKRLQQFLDEILPAAARLEVSHLDDDGNFIFRDFQMRAGIMPFKKARVMGFEPGSRFMEKGNLYTVGELVAGKGFLLLRDMLAEDQAIIHQEFHAKFPESAHYLDRFIMPGMEESRYMGPQGTMTAEFNRHSLLSLFNEWPQELRDLFGPMPLPELPYVEGYTPDVAEQKTLVNIISSLLRRFKSGARKFKAGEARESGNVKNLFEGFSVRAMEAHREKIRVQTRQKLIEAAALPEDRIPLAERHKYVPVDTTFNRLLEAVKIASRLDKTRYKAITDALNPADQALMIRILGDAYRLRGRGLMIHKEVERELMLGAAREPASNALTKILAWLLELYNAALLATPFTAITNWASNEVVKTVRIANRLSYAMISAATGDPKAAKLGAYEFGFLLRGFITDRFPQWQRTRIQQIVPRELFDDQTGLEAMDIDPNTTVIEQLQRLNLGGAFLQAIQYGEIDIRQKQQLAYAAYRAHGEVAADEVPGRDYRDDKGEKISRREWIRNWIGKAPDAVHRDIYLTTVLYMMDYQNVPAWLDASQSSTAMGKAVKRALFPFAKWPYNMARQFKRFSLDSALDLVLKDKTREQRVNGAANLMLMAGLVALGAWLVGADDDSDDNEKLIGTSVDSEGKLLEAAFRTGNRINSSRLMRILFAHGLMRGASFNLNDGTDEGRDLWWRYRNYPYLKEGILLGYAAKGDWSEFGNSLTDVLGEYVSLGILAKIAWPSPFDKDKPLLYRTTEALYDFTTAGVVPPPWRQFAVKLVDPVMRRSTPSDNLEYEANPIDAILVNTPGLSKFAPAAGKPIKGSFAPFSADEWFKREAASVQKNPEIPAENKPKIISSLRDQAKKLAIPPLQQRDIFLKAGLPVENMRMDRTTTVPAAADIKRLTEMGVGPESYRYVERVDKNGVKYREVVYPDPATVRTTSPGVEATRFFGGLNVMPVPRGAVRKALTADEMFNRK